MRFLIKVQTKNCLKLSLFNDIQADQTWTSSWRSFGHTFLKVQIGQVGEKLTFELGPLEIQTLLEISLWEPKTSNEDPTIAWKEHSYCWCFRNPAGPVEVGSLSHYFQGFLHPRWCRISEPSTVVQKNRGWKTSFLLECSSCALFPWRLERWFRIWESSILPNQFMTTHLTNGRFGSK